MNIFVSGMEQYMELITVIIVLKKKQLFVRN